MKILHLGLLLSLLMSTGTQGYAEGTEALELRILDIAKNHSNYKVVESFDTYRVAGQITADFYRINEDFFVFSDLIIIKDKSESWSLEIFKIKFKDLKFNHEPIQLFMVKNSSDITIGYHFLGGPLSGIYLIRKINSLGDKSTILSTQSFISSTGKEVSTEEYTEDFLYKYQPFYYFLNNKKKFCQKSFVTCSDGK